MSIEWRWCRTLARTTGCNWPEEVRKLESIIRSMHDELKANSASAEWFWYKPELYRVEFWRDGKSEDRSVEEALDECLRIVSGLDDRKPDKKALEILADLAKNVDQIAEKMGVLRRTDMKFREVTAEQERLKAIGDAEGLRKVNEIFQKMLRQANLGVEPQGLIERRGQIAMRGESRASLTETTGGTATAPVGQVREVALGLAEQLRSIRIDNEWMAPMNSDIQKLADKLERIEEVESPREREELLTRADFWLDGYDDMEAIGKLVDTALAEMRPVSTRGIPPEYVVFAVEFFSRLYPEVGLRYDATYRTIRVGGA